MKSIMKNLPSIVLNRSLINQLESYLKKIESDFHIKKPVAIDIKIDGQTESLATINDFKKAWDNNIQEVMIKLGGAEDQLLIILTFSKEKEDTTIAAGIPAGSGLTDISGQYTAILNMLKEYKTNHWIAYHTTLIAALTLAASLVLTPILDFIIHLSSEQFFVAGLAIWLIPAVALMFLLPKRFSYTTFAQDARSK